ncbi:MAG: sigma-70 family RNA polymerase sigma factor, partial [Bryobacterales bacterium]|nr:sigma-70 family RNA polymerase sigma factor [Bryobacterales bacterium]
GYVRSVVRRHGALCIGLKIKARRRLVDVCTAADWAAADPDQEANLLSRERSDLMHRGLGRLCKRDRELITRFYLQGESLHQICQEMNLTATQFRLFKSRAKAKLAAWTQTHS